MKTDKIKPNFTGLQICNIKPLHTIYIKNIKYLEKLASGKDVFIRSTTKDFPYRKSMVSVSSLEILVRPQKLNFFQKLFGTKTVREYFPTGNYKDLIKFNETFEDVFKKAISKVM